MSIVNKLKALKGNLFGGKGNTGETRPPASTVQTFDLQSSPTGILDIDPLGFNTFSYPLDTQVNYENGHYMLFYVNVQEKSKYTYDNYISKKTYDTIIKGESENEQRYKKLRDLKRKVYNTDDAAGAGQGDTSYTASTTRYSAAHDTEYTVLEKRKGSNNKGVSSNFNNTRRICDSVSLYLPPNVEESTSAGYNEAATGIAGFLVSSYGKGLANMDAAALTRKLGNSMEGIIKDLTFRAIGMAGELVGAEGVEALAKKAFGEADNPYMEVLFDRMQLRTFTYNFEFAPRNEKEALEVQSIIQLFRFHMAPELRPDVNRYLGLPSQFDIHYMYLSKDGVASENNYYNKIATCVLQDCKINYTPNGVKSFEDGGPTRTTMTLVFKEIELLTKDKIAKGF
jgi:hypothetical protein